MLTLEVLKEYLSYDAATGDFTWVKKPGRGRSVGSKAGTINGSGYLQITLFGTTHLAHRLAWFYTHGVWPKRLDHRDRIRHHNWMDNLREVTQSQNAFYTKRDASNVTGARGVTLAHDGKYRATIYCQGKKINLGRHDTLEAAKAAYDKKAAELFPGFVVEGE